jgi:hypothetical protein
MIAMVITYVGIRIDYKGQGDVVNNEYSVENSKYYHVSYTNLLIYIDYNYEYKIHSKASLNVNAH